MNKEELYDAFARIDEKYVNESSPSDKRKGRGRSGPGVWKNSVLPVLLTVVLLGGGITAGVLIARSVRSSEVPESSHDPRIEAPTNDPAATVPTDPAAPTATTAPVSPTAPNYTRAPTVYYDTDGWPAELPSGEEELKQLKSRCLEIIAETYPEFQRFDPEKIWDRSSSYSDGDWDFVFFIGANERSMLTYRVGVNNGRLRISKDTPFPDDVIVGIQNLSESRMQEYLDKMEAIIRAQIDPAKLKEPDDLRSTMNWTWDYDGGAYMKCESIIYTVDPESFEFGCQGHAHLFAKVEVTDDIENIEQTPAAERTDEPTAEQTPAAELTDEPTAEQTPTAELTDEPTAEPTLTAELTAEPTLEPTPEKNREFRSVQLRHDTPDYLENPSTMYSSNSYQLRPGGGIYSFDDHSYVAFKVFDCGYEQFEKLIAWHGGDIPAETRDMLEKKEAGLLMFWLCDLDGNKIDYVYANKNGIVAFSLYPGEYRIMYEDDGTYRTNYSSIIKVEVEDNESRYAFDGTYYRIYNDYDATGFSAYVCIYNYKRYKPVTITVTDSETGSPVADAKIAIYAQYLNENSKYMLTDSSGFLRLNCIFDLMILTNGPESIDSWHDNISLYFEKDGYKSARIKKALPTDTLFEVQLESQ